MQLLPPARKPIHRKGCLILATTDDVDQVKASQVSPLVWFSKKITRVVSSTLASETYALSGALGLLSWTTYALGLDSEPVNSLEEY